MLLDHNKIVIFSHPRTGTKLLAGIFQNFGYHVHGEWFSLRSTVINNGQIERKSLRSTYETVSEGRYRDFRALKTRLGLFKHREKSVVTIWPNVMSDFPFLYNHFKDYYYVGIRRNVFDQLLSYYISSKNENFDGEKISQPVEFKYEAFQKSFWDYYRICELQDWLIKENKCTLINFDRLISGKETALDSSYSVNSNDQHLNLESLVSNINEVKGWYAYLERQRAIALVWE